MTKEVAQKIVKGITDKIECNTADIDDWAEFWGFTKEEYEEFLDMAIVELEKPVIIEKVIEDIKAELSNLIDWHDCPIEYDGGCDAWYRTAINQALEIIDKHIGEEVKE